MNLAQYALCAPAVLVIDKKNKYTEKITKKNIRTA